MAFLTLLLWSRSSRKQMNLAQYKRLTAAARESLSSATAGTPSVCVSPSPTRTTSWPCRRESRSRPEQVIWIYLACEVHFGLRLLFSSIWNWTTSEPLPIWLSRRKKSTGTLSAYDGRHHHRIKPFWPWQNLSSDRKRLNCSSTWTCTRTASSVASPSLKFSSTSRSMNSKPLRLQYLKLIL